MPILQVPHDTIRYDTIVEFNMVKVKYTSLL